MPLDAVEGSTSPPTAGEPCQPSLPFGLVWVSCSGLGTFLPAVESALCLTCLFLTSTPKPKNRPPSPAAPKSRPLSPLVPAAASKTPTGKKTPPGTKSRPKRSQTPARVQPQTPAVVAIDKDQDVQQPDSQEDKSECPCVT